jgi:hypothetical protein
MAPALGLSAPSLGLAPPPLGLAPHPFPQVLAPPLLVVILAMDFRVAIFVAPRNDGFKSQITRQRP